MGKLNKSGQVILTRARTLGRTKTRDELKQQGKSFSAITSPRSLEIHKKNWDDFSLWAEKKGYKKIKKIDEKLVKEFLIEKANSGGRGGKSASVKTLKSYITSINKVMCSSNVWEEKNKMELKGISEIKITEEQKRVYKKESPSDWIEKHKRSYESNKSYIDTLSAFGLRRREMSDLSKQSFVIDKNNKMYVQTVGKGGKVRLAESTKEQNNNMIALYGGYAKRIDDVKEFKSKLSSDYILRAAKTEPLNLRQSNNHKIPSHIFRNKYAQTLLKEKIEEYKSDSAVLKAYSSLTIDDKYKDIETTINGTKGSIRAFYEVSENLGHNRLDVLTKYI